MTPTIPLVALCLAAVVALPLAGALFGFGLAWGRDLYAEWRVRAPREADAVAVTEELR